MDTVRMAENFCKKHGGKKKFKWMIDQFKEGTKLEEIAQKITNEQGETVSKVRVKQWRDAFGDLKPKYSVGKDIATFLQD